MRELERPAVLSGAETLCEIGQNPMISPGTLLPSLTHMHRFHENLCRQKVESKVWVVLESKNLILSHDRHVRDDIDI